MTGRRNKIASNAWVKWRAPIAATLVVILSLTGGGCFLDNEVETYYGRVITPRVQEFRWSDGGLPEVFDPALAAAPPDTDVVRALFEGLTEYDPKTLAPVPGVASRWESKSDGREWVFHLRRDARWSNNDPVTANDFVRSWKRTLQLGARAPHAKLLANIVGAAPAVITSTISHSAVEPPQTAPGTSDKEQVKGDASKEAKSESRQEAAAIAAPAFGVEAVNDYVLRVRLQQPDVSFPALVAHTVFRPVHESNVARIDAAAFDPVSNGPFRLSKTERDSVVLERAGNYWDARTVSLTRVQFVAARDAESALAAYQAGDIDAVTNAGFSPLALKLLTPYKDFRRETYGALTHYSFNMSRPPFDDVRVREALAIAIDRDRISEDQMGGATEPAVKFFPGNKTETKTDGTSLQLPTLEYNAARARLLLAEAGYHGGQNFPVVKLLVNRNDQQRIVAEAIAKMWRNVLGITTEIMIKNWSEYEAALRAGAYDVARRGMVMQTTAETVSLRALFELDALTDNNSAPLDETAADGAANSSVNKSSAAEPAADAVEKLENDLRTPTFQILSEAQALKELPTIPIYFASSHALVKPYVVGFNSNLLDAPSLKNVRIDTSWQLPQKEASVRFNY